MSSPEKAHWHALCSPWGWRKNPRQGERVPRDARRNSRRTVSVGCVNTCSVHWAREHRTSGPIAWDLIPCVQTSNSVSVPLDAPR